MKKYIVLGVIVYAAWYFLVREKPIKPVVVVPSKDPSAPNIVVSSDITKVKDKLPPVYANPNDTVVANMIDTINQEYPKYRTAAEFTAARTKLYLNSQTQTVSDDLSNKAKELIDLLDQYALQYQNIETTHGSEFVTANGLFIS